MAEGFTFAVEKALTEDNVEELRQSVLGVLSNLKEKLFVFDLEKVSEVDAYGIGFLAATYNSLKQKDGKVQVVNINSEEIKDLFITINLDKYIELR